jgi:glycine cleavage system H protein
VFYFFVGTFLSYKIAEQAINKGVAMVVALVLLTFLVFITIDLIRRRKARTAAVSRLSTQPIEQVLERYFYPGHSWALVEDPRSVTVGVDDLVSRVVGKPDRIEIATMGATLRQGEPLVTLHSGSRSLSLGSPLSGVVEEINPSLSAQPSLLADSPLEKGWIARLVPGNLSAEIPGLLNGPAARRWREAVRIKIASLFSPRLGMVLQDGGEWIDNMGSLLNDEEWRELTHVLFPTDPSIQSKN